MIWTEEKKRQFCSMWKAGASFEEMMETFGVTRNALMGASWRMGLPKRRKPQGETVKRIPKGRTVKVSINKPAPEVIDDCVGLSTLGESNGCLHLTGRHDERGFPIVCGKPRARLSYCPYHANTYYVRQEWPKS